MFEKEALYYGYHQTLGVSISEMKQSAYDWQKGAEFGYNKANEWHYVKNGVFPEEGETVFCFCRGYCGVSFCATARLYIGYDDKVRRWWTNAGAGKSEQLMDVIAWKEIVFPKEIEK
ncbi:MAG: hypothetical protein J6P28_03440 [Treponema sp.]|nr:hypothetical protein [Treponema sp.]